eukprot:1150199-Pelagomonas_calceolata.AAC.8
MQIRAHNLEPALQWAASHAGQLPESSGSVGYRGLGSAGKGPRKGPHPPSAFEFKLHALNFLTTLTQQGAECVVSGVERCMRHCLRVFFL